MAEDLVIVKGDKTEQYEALIPQVQASFGVACSYVAVTPTVPGQ